MLELVAKWNSEIFSHLHTYCVDRKEYLDPTIARFDREIQFYLAPREYVDRFGGGLAFCNPQLSTTNHNLYARLGFDLALAEKLRDEKQPTVCNDFHIDDPERVLVISGPNQAGKTTFARMFGPVHYLARVLGLWSPLGPHDYWYGINCLRISNGEKIYKPFGVNYKTI